MKKVKTTIAWVEAKRNAEYEKSVEKLLARAEESRIKYEQKFHNFRAKTFEFRRIDYKVYGGMEKYQPGFGR